MFRRVTLAIIGSLFTVHSAMVYVIQTAFEQDQDGTQFHPGPARKLSTNLYDIQTAFEQDQDGTQFHLGPPQSCIRTCMTYTIAECTVNKLLMMDRRTLRNM